MLDYDNEPMLTEPSGFVKIIVLNKTNELMFDRFVHLYQQLDLKDLQINDNSIDYSTTDEEVQTKSNMELMVDFINDCETNLNKENLKGHLLEIYNEAMTL